MRAYDQKRKLGLDTADLHRAITSAGMIIAKLEKNYYRDDRDDKDPFRDVTNRETLISGEQAKIGLEQLVTGDHSLHRFVDGSITGDGSYKTTVSTYSDQDMQHPIDVQTSLHYESSDGTLH